MDNRLLKWTAICGTTVYREEYNSFSQIDKDTLEYFTLEGLGSVFKHNVKTGQFFIDDNPVVILVNDRLAGKSSDIINYKEVIAPTGHVSDSTIVGYYTGWKQDDLSGLKNLEILFWIDMVEQQIKLRVRGTPTGEEVLNNSTITLIVNGKMFIQELELIELNKRHENVYLIPLA